MADFPLFAKPDKHAHRLLDGNAGIDPVKLEKVDPFDAEIAQAAFDRTTEMSLAVVHSDAGIVGSGRPFAGHAALGGDDE